MGDELWTPIGGNIGDPVTNTTNETKFVGWIHESTLKMIAFTDELKTTLDAVTEFAAAVEGVYEAIQSWWDSMTMHSILITTKQYDPGSLVAEINTGLANDHTYDVPALLGGRLDALDWHVAAQAAAYWGTVDLPPGYVVKGSGSNKLHMYHVRWHNPWFVVPIDPGFYLSPEWMARGVVSAGFNIDGWVGCIAVEQAVDLPQTPAEAQNFVTQKVKPVDKAPGLFTAGSTTTDSSKVLGTIVVLGIAGVLVYMAMKK